MKILIVEDEPVSREFLQNTLEKWNHEVRVAADGKEALAVLLKEKINFIITDWLMPVYGWH